MKSLYVILNPVAGSGQPDLVRNAVAQMLTPAFADYEIYQTTGQEDMAAVVQNALQQGFDYVVAAGGDGTVSLVADGLAETAVPLGILPIGTGNLVARELGIPLDLAEACRLASEPEPERTVTIDGMRVGDKTFVSHVSLGVYSQVIRRTRLADKQRFGRLAYLWSAARELMRVPAWTFHLDVDGTTYQERASMVMVANVGVVGIPPLRWGPDIDPRDGRIDVCVVKATTAADYLRLLGNVWQGTHGRDRQIKYLSAREQIKLRVSRALPVRADGELIGQSQVSLKVIPNAVQVVAPEPDGTPYDEMTLKEAYEGFRPYT